MFREFIIFTIIIFIHELGHFIMAQYYGWDIDKIYIYPFGGYVKFNTDINKPIKEELYILSMGLILQYLFYLVILFFYSINLIEITTLMIIKKYHYSIMIFNLLPIFPLDGARLLNLIMSIKLPFKLSHKIMIYLSYIILVIVFSVSIKYFIQTNLFLILVLLLTKVIEENKNHDSIFNKFLLERYLKDYNFTKLKIIKNNIYKMVRDKKHLFLINNNYVSEKEILRERFRNKLD
ncbi:MAG: site-2 protease family protein [Bacilli bacterium]|nr:site-2 protease family protein [Bacilli bacterium]